MKWYYKLAREIVAIAFTALLIIATMSHGINQTDALAQPMENNELMGRLRSHVETLAGEIGERNVFRPIALAQAADYIERTWRDQGFEVIRYDHETRGQNVSNLEITRPGNSAEVVLIGAHYDSVLGSPGANDNGSGLAAMLELSRYVAGQRPTRTVRFVAFVNEEPPFFKTPSMGSRIYVRTALARGDQIRAMLCLETIGFYSNAPDSQHYPPLFNLFYPDKGNFIGFVSNFRSRGLLKQAVAAFRSRSDFPIEHVATFGWIPGVDWSDHWSFWREGIPAIMITDTAPYRYPYYHTPQDTPDRVIYERLTRVTEALFGVIDAIASPDKKIAP